MGIHVMPPYYETVIKKVLKIEEQIEHDAGLGLDGTNKTRGGQLFSISPNRKIAKLAFKMAKLGSPTGDITFTIRSHATGNILNSKVWGDASALPSAYPPAEWQEVTFDTLVLINEIVYMLAEFSGGDASNQVAMAIFTAYDIKANEYLWDMPFGAHVEDDCTYRYKYYEV